MSGTLFPTKMTPFGFRAFIASVAQGLGNWTVYRGPSSSLIGTWEGYLLDVDKINRQLGMGGAATFPERGWYIVFFGATALQIDDVVVNDSGSRWTVRSVDTRLPGVVSTEVGQ